MSIFKAYDIRGVYPDEINEEIVYKTGLAYAILRKKEIEDEEGSKRLLKIVVGADMRISSPSLKKNLIKGLTDGGADVIDIGLSSTPTFYFSVAHYKYDGGILVSASHNPKNHNGLKIVRKKAIPVSGDSGMKTLEEMTKNPLIKSEKKGKVTIKKGVLNDQVKYDLSFCNIKNIKPLKIVIDTANSMGSTYFDALFPHLNCEIIKMNWELDGTFPAHEADPLKSENMNDLCKEVIKNKADLGIATDGDGDRIFFVDNKGDRLEPGITRAILCKIFLKEKPGAKIAYDIRPGKITPDTIIANGGIPIITRVGHSLIKEQAIKEGAYFAGESSGHFFLNMEEGCYEVPLIITMKLLEELSISNKTFSDYSKPFEKYFHSGEINMKVKDIKSVIESIKIKYKDAKQNSLDGVSIEYKDWWFNVRGSNTEPIIRLNLEAKNKKLMEEKRDEVLAFIRS